MPIRVPITKTDMRRIATALRTQEVVMCLDEVSYLRTLLVGQDRLMRGLPVKAEIVKAYEVSQ